MDVECPVCQTRHATRHHVCASSACRCRSLDVPVDMFGDPVGAEPAGAGTVPVPAASGWPEGMIPIDIAARRREEWTA